MSETDDKALVAQILSSYLSNNTVAANDLPTVIASVKRAFGGDADSMPTPATEGEPRKWQPAVPIKRSVSPEELICLCCGEKFKSLKWHLQSAHQLSPEGYRAAFDLKSDYPLVAPAYAARRSELESLSDRVESRALSRPVRKAARRAYSPRKRKRRPNAAAKSLPPAGPTEPSAGRRNSARLRRGFRNTF